MLNTAEEQSELPQTCRKTKKKSLKIQLNGAEIVFNIFFREASAKLKCIAISISLSGRSKKVHN